MSDKAENTGCDTTSAEGVLLSAIVLRDNVFYTKDSEAILLMDLLVFRLAEVVRSLKAPADNMQVMMNAA